MRAKGRKYASQQRVAVVLDVGTHKMCCLVARLMPPPRFQDAPSPFSRIQILGQGYQRSRGIVAGRIAEMDAAERTIRSVVAQAERSADVTVNEVYVTASFGPLHSDSFVASVDLPGGSVTARDMVQVMNAAREYAGRGGKAVLHVAPFGYTLGYESGITDPLGMIGDALKVDVHAVSIESLPFRNLRHCIERSHLAVKGVSVAAFTSAKAVITDAEAHAGVTCLDMGAGTTGISVFSGGHLVHCDSIGIGGNHITNDIAEAFSMSLAEAERLKTLYTSVLGGHDDPHEAVPAEDDDDYHGALSFCQLSKADLSDVARIRLEEMFAEICERLRASGVGPMSGQKLVLTGGSSELIGAAELAAHIFGKQPRLGRPRPTAGMPEQDVNPAFSAPLGLLVHLLEDDHGIGVGVTPEIIAASQGYLARVGQWLRESF